MLGTVIPLDTISIHIPRVGDDGAMIESIKLWMHFYPHPPRGGRLSFCMAYWQSWLFLSTSPAWGTTTTMMAAHAKPGISIHIPRVGDD